MTGGWERRRLAKPSPPRAPKRETRAANPPSASILPVIPAKAGIQTGAAGGLGLRGFVRIRICGIMGFSGFFRLVDIRLGRIFGYGKQRKPGESKS